MFEPRKVYPTGKSQLERDAFYAGLQQAYNLCGKSDLYPHIVAGKEIFAADRSTYETFDPNVPGAALAAFPKHDLSNPVERSLLDEALAAVSRRQKDWAKVHWEKRAQLLYTIAQRLEDQMWFFLGLMALEGGKRPFPNGVGEFIEAPDFCRSAALLAKKMYEEASPIAPDFMCDFNGTVWEPKGVIVDIGPFNFPIAIPTDKIAMAIVTGNAIIMKASGHTPLQAYMLYQVIQSAFDACGLENNGVVNFLSGHGGEMATFLLNHPVVTGYTFTGSRDAYKGIKRAMAEKEMDHGGDMQPIAIETSGCNALIIAEDADIDAAVIAARDSLINNNGQTCSHLGHLIVDSKVAEVFMEKFRNALRDVSFGDVKDLKNQCGALISREAVERCEKSVRQLIGERLVVPNWMKEIKNRNAFDFAPRILVALPKTKADDALVWKLRSTEVFGMAVTVWFTDTREEAKRIFESGVFGLTGGIFTNDPEYALDFALHYRGAAQKYVNTRITGATVGMAFGGSALSGSSGDGVGASTRQALQKYVSHVNVGTMLPKGLDHNRAQLWHSTFAAQMTTAPKFEK